MNKITLVGRQEPDGLPEASIKISIGLEFSPDSPPALVEAIGKSLAEMLKVWGSDDELQKIVRECDDIRARHQRQADHATELLLSRPAGPEENEREPEATLAESIRWRRCHRCDEPYGRAVAGCSECQPIRALLGVEEPKG